MRWFEAFPGVQGAEPLRGDLLSHWPDRAFDDRLRHLRFCPVILTEIYQVARHFPLAVVEGSAGPTVAIDMRPEVLSRPAFTEDGLLAGGYRPLATRLLPFFCDPGGGPMRLIDDLADSGPERPDGLRDHVRAALRAQQAGFVRLEAAARLAIARGLLRQEARPAERGEQIWTTAPALSGDADFDGGSGEPMGKAALANLALTFRLVAVMEFSQRHRRTDGAVAPHQGVARDLLRRDDALRDQTFLGDGALVDFTRLQFGTAEEPHEA